MEDGTSRAIAVSINSVGMRARRIIRLLLFVTEVGLFAGGIIFPFVVPLLILVHAGYQGPNYDEMVMVPAVFLLILTIGALFMFRRKTRRWKIGYDAESWSLERTASALHPVRAKWMRRVRTFCVWIPSVVAAFVLFFLPLASHLLHPSSRFLPHYKVPIPWTVMVFPQIETSDSVTALASHARTARFGVTSLWIRQEPAMMDFAEWNVSPAQRSDGHQAAPTCTKSAYFTVWRISCDYPIDVGNRSVHASFTGLEEDIPTFNQIVEGMTPVE